MLASQREQPSMHHSACGLRIPNTTEQSPSFSTLRSETSGMRTNADVNFLGDKVRPELLRQYAQWSGVLHLPALMLGH